MTGSEVLFFRPTSSPSWAPAGPLTTTPLGDDGWVEIGTIKDGPVFPPLEPARGIGPGPFYLTDRAYSITLDLDVSPGALRWLRRLVARDYRAEQSAMRAEYHRRRLARRRRNRRG